MAAMAQRTSCLEAMQQIISEALNDVDVFEQALTVELTNKFVEGALDLLEKQHNEFAVEKQVNTLFPSLP